jgi:methionine-rich copper-binding protein CopC
MMRIKQMKMRYILGTLLVTVFFITLPGYAAAHAFLDHSSPSADAVVEKAPTSVRLWFSRALEPSFSTVRVVDAQGKHVDDGKPAVNDKESKLLEVGLQALTSGKYKVIWRIVALDGHKAKGELAFTLK